MFSHPYVLLWYRKMFVSLVLVNLSKLKSEKYVNVKNGDLRPPSGVKCCVLNHWLWPKLFFTRAFLLIKPI